MFNFVRNELEVRWSMESFESKFEKLTTWEYVDWKWYLSKLKTWPLVKGSRRRLDHDIYLEKNPNDGCVDIRIDDLAWDPILVWVPINKVKKEANRFVDNWISTFFDTSFSKESIVKVSKRESTEHRAKLEGGKWITVLQEEFNTPLTTEYLNTQKSLFDEMLSNNDLSASELQQIDYIKLNTILRQSFSSKQEKTQEFLDSREWLLISINLVKEEYKKRTALSDKNFPRNQEFDKFLKWMKEIKTYMIDDTKRLKESLVTMTLDELLYTYDELKNDDYKRYMVTSKIIEKHILWKNNHLAFWVDWNVIIENNISDPVTNSFWLVNDNESQLIISRVNEEDLKGHLVKDVILSSWFDVTNKTTNYEVIVNDLFSKHTIEDSSWWKLVYNDIFTRKDEINSIITEKLNKTNDIEERNELQFLLCYIKKQDSFSVNVIKKATDIAIFKKTWIDPSTNEWFNRIWEAFKSKKWIRTLINDVMSANGWMVWAAVIIMAIYWLFAGWKWRKFTWATLWILIGWPALEQLAHKWGGVDIFKDMFSWESNKNRSKYEAQWYDGVKVTVNNLPDQYDAMYKAMYKENMANKWDSRIHEQDYSQIFSQLVQKEEVKSKTVVELKAQLNNKTKSLEDILWSWNVPNNYQIWAISVSEGNELIKNRQIQWKDVRKFLILLLSTEGNEDKTLWDLFVSWQEETTEFIANDIYKTENDVISKQLENIPYNHEARDDVDNILKELDNLWKVAWDDGSLKEKVEGMNAKLIIVWANHSDIKTSIDLIIAEYEKVITKLWVSEEVRSFNNESGLDGELIFWLSSLKEWINGVIWLTASAAWYLKLPVWFNINELNRVKPEEIDKLIEKWNDLLAKFINKEQRNEINEIVKQLRLKKLTILRTKDRLSKFKTPSDGTQKAMAELLENYKEENETRIKEIDLEIMPNQENISEYSKLIVYNYESIVFLRSITEIDDTFLWVEWKALKQSANIKLESFRTKGLALNLKLYINKEKLKFTNHWIDSTRFSYASFDNNLKSIKEKESELLDVKDELFKDWVISDFISQLWELMDITDILPSNNKINDIEAYYNKLCNTNEVFNWIEFVQKVNSVIPSVFNEARKALLWTLGTSLKNFTLPTNLKPGQNWYENFAEDVVKYRSLYKEIWWDTYIKGQEKVINDLIKSKIEDAYVKKIDGVTDLLKIWEISDEWAILEKKMEYNGEAFNKKFDLEIKEIWKKELELRMNNKITQESEIEITINTFLATNEWKEILNSYWSIKGKDISIKDFVKFLENTILTDNSLEQTKEEVQMLLSDIESKIKDSMIIKLKWEVRYLKDETLSHIISFYKEVTKSL